MTNSERIYSMGGKTSFVIRTPIHKWVCQNCGEKYDQEWLICESCGGEDFETEPQ